MSRMLGAFSLLIAAVCTFSLIGCATNAALSGRHTDASQPERNVVSFPPVRVANLELSHEAALAIASGSSAQVTSWSYLPRHLTDLLPSTQILWKGRDDTTISGNFVDAIVHGRLTQSEVYESHRWEESYEVEEDEQPRRVSETDQADTRILHLTFEVSEQIAVTEDLEVPSTITASLVINGSQDPQLVGAGLLGLGDVVLFLTEPDGETTDPGWRITLEGETIGQVAPDGTITFPVRSALSDLHVSGLLSEVQSQTSLDELQALAAQPPRVVTVN